MPTYYFYKEMIFEVDITNNSNNIHYDACVKPCTRPFCELPVDTDNKWFSISNKLLEDYTYPNDHNERFYEDKEFDWSRCGTLVIDECQVSFVVKKGFPYWNEMFDMIKNVTTFYAELENAPPHYNWLSQVEEIVIRKGCTLEIFNSGKVVQTNYETWMDVASQPEIAYKIEDYIDYINPAVKHLVLKFFGPDDASAIKSLNLKSLVVVSYVRAHDLFEWLHQVETETLQIWWDIPTVEEISDIVALDKFPILKSNRECSKEVVDNTRYLIGGSFPIAGIPMSQCDDYLESIFARNRRCLNTKSANK